MKTKKVFKFFTIVDYEEEAEFLRSMHRKGWRFVRVSFLGIYHFEECAPEDVIYQLDYNQEGLAHKTEYVQIFNDCGWEYIQDYLGYSYFRKPASLATVDEEIFCDDESRLEMMNRIFKGRVLPLVTVFCCCLIPQFITNITVFHNYGLALFLGGLIAFCLAVFIMFAVKRDKYKKRIGK